MRLPLARLRGSTAISRPSNREETVISTGWTNSTSVYDIRSVMLLSSWMTQKK